MQNRFTTTTALAALITRQRGLPSLALLCLLMWSLAGASAVSGLQTNAPVKPQNTKTLICVVSGEGPPEMSLDAVVLVDRGKLLPLYAEDNEAAQTRFANEYFRAGRRYRLTFGGGEAGTAAIKRWDKGCNNIHANAEVATSANIHGQVMALATDSETLGRKESARRAPTDDERASMMQLVKQVYTSKTTPAALLKKIATTNLTATDLDGDGKFELVGSFVIATPNKFRRDLFLIAEPQPASYKAALVEYEAYKLPPEGFDSAIKLVDQLDLDGDGIGEVFAIQGGFDAYGYSIYKKQDGRWRKVYTATGDAC